MPDRDPDALLADLDPAQREAVEITSGPLCILAGAGSGKTRVISRRVAYALATGVVRPRDVLVVTFTDKAAGEMRAGWRRSATPAWRPRRSMPPPSASSAISGRASTAATRRRSSNRRCRSSPRWRPGSRAATGSSQVRDLAGEIEWAKARRIRPNEYEMRAIADDRDASLPPDLMAGLYRRYETAKARAGRIDFEDMLELTIGLIEADATIAAEVRDRYRWFSVDEYQDTNPLQAALLDAWLGGREDLAVVGDEDQTIYTFTGATSDYLIGFAERYPTARVVRLETNYRSTPEVLALANRVLAAGRAAPDERLPGVAPRPPKRLVASLAAGPGAGDRRVRDRRGRAGRDDRARSGRSGGPGPRTARWRSSSERTPSSPPSRTRSGPPGSRSTSAASGSSPDRRSAARCVWPPRSPASRARNRWSPGCRPPSNASSACAATRVPEGEAAAERHGAVVTLLELAEDLARTDPAADVPAFLAEVERRAEIEAGGTATGVELLTYHRAKGLEWDAVFLPALEEGTLPIRQSTEPDELAEERRLLYVGITRARRYLWLSWATTQDGGDRTRRPAQPLALPRWAGAAVGPPARGGRDCRTRGGPAARPRRSTRPTGRRSRTRSVPGARPVPAPTRSPRSSSSTTRPSRPSRRAARARSRSSAGSPASVR